MTHEVGMERTMTKPGLIIIVSGIPSHHIELMANLLKEDFGPVIIGVEGDAGLMDKAIRIENDLSVLDMHHHHMSMLSALEGIERNIFMPGKKEGKQDFRPLKSRKSAWATARRQMQGSAKGRVVRKTGRHRAS